MVGVGGGGGMAMGGEWADSVDPTAPPIIWTKNPQNFTQTQIYGFDQHALENVFNSRHLFPA